MTNYNELLKNAQTIEEVKEIVEKINDDISDNAEFVLTESKLTEKIKGINMENEIIFSRSFVYKLRIDRKTAFQSLLTNPCFDVYSVKIEDNGTYTINESTRIFKFSHLEKTLQGFDENRDKNGKIIYDTTKTIFSALRFYGLCRCFIRNLQKSNFEIDGEGYNLEKVKIGDKQIFTADDGKCFASNSNNALEKQLNILVKFMEYDVKMLKRDLPILKIKAQKIKQDKKNANFSVNAILTDNAVLNFANVIFGLVTTRMQGKDVEVITKKDTTAEATTEATKEETTTEE